MVVVAIITRLGSVGSARTIIRVIYMEISMEISIVISISLSIAGHCRQRA